MDNQRVARELVKLAKTLTEERKAGTVSREVDTAYGKAAVALTDLDSAMRKSRDFPKDWQRVLVGYVGDVIDAHDKLGHIIEDYREKV